MKAILFCTLSLIFPGIIGGEQTVPRVLGGSLGDHHICPSYCECLREETVDWDAIYSAECHVALNTLPLVCGKRWTSLKVNINNHSTAATANQNIVKSADSIFSYCHDLTSLYLRQVGEVQNPFVFQAVIQGLRDLRRIWFHFMQIEIDGTATANFYNLPAKIELIDFSDCHINLDVGKALFFNAPLSLRQLRLTNVSLTGVFSRHLLDNLCHTASNAIRPNDLVSLYLDKNYLEGLARDSLVGCRHLRVLQLSYNHLVGTLEEVTSVQISKTNNKWTTEYTHAALESFALGVLEHTPFLQALDLSGNFITGISSPMWAFGRNGSEFHSLTELRTISLSNNNLSFIVRGAFQGAPNLREIDLSRNPKLFCPTHIDTPHFYSYIDPYIFGGVEKLTKIYWDFSDKTCILSAMMSDSTFGILSEGLFRLFSSRPLCLSELPPIYLENINASVTPSTLENKPNKILTMEMMKASWSAMEITSSFLCGLIGLLLISLLIVLIINCKTIYEAISDCCCNSPKDPGQSPNTIRTSSKEERDGRRSNPCNTLPRSRFLLLTNKEIELNNGAGRSSSLQNLCLACLEQPPSTSVAYAQPLEFYDNYRHLTTSFVSEGGKTQGRCQVKRTSGTEVTRVLMEQCQQTPSPRQQTERRVTIPERNYI